MGHFPVHPGKQKAEKCWAAAARGSAPCHPSVHLLPRGISMWDVVIGATDLRQPGPEAVVRHIQRLLVHQHYVAATARNDIALVELDQPVECSDYIQLGCVPDASLRVSELKSCYIAGWNFARSEFSNRMCAPRASWAHWGHGLGTLGTRTRHTGDTDQAPRGHGPGTPGTRTRHPGDTGWALRGHRPDTPGTPHGLGTDRVRPQDASGAGSEQPGLGEGVPAKTGRGTG